MVRVLIAEDHPLFRVALTEALMADGSIRVVAGVGDGWSALRTARAMQPDVVVLDVKMPGLDGPEVARELLRTDPHAKILFLSGSDSPAVVERCFAAGATGFMVKDAINTEIRRAVTDVHTGTKVLPEFVRKGVSKEAPVLTEREQTVLEHVSRGLSVADIATAMHLSPATIKTHLQNVYFKLGVNERAAAVAEAMRRRILH